MSTFRDPPRILQSSESVPDLIREGLEAERVDRGPDASHIERLAERLATPSRMVATTPAASMSWSRLGTIAGIGLLATAGLFVQSRAERSAPAGNVGVAPVTAQPAAALAEKRDDDRSQRRDDERGDEPPTMRPDELPTAAPAAAQPPARVVRPAVSSAPTRPAAPEGAEIDLLARAQEALRSRPAETLALCQKHQAEFAEGRFTQEREALAIEALLYLRRRPEAEQRWNDFQRRYPASNHRRHLADLFSSPSP